MKPQGLDEAPRPAEWKIRCDWCGAPAGARCTTQRGRPLAIPSHDARTTAWTNTQTTERQQQTGDDQ